MAEKHAANAMGTHSNHTCFLAQLKLEPQTSANTKICQFLQRKASVLQKTCKTTSLPIIVMVHMLRAACAHSV